MDVAPKAISGIEIGNENLWVANNECQFNWAQ